MIALKTIDSTSLEAQRRLQAGATPPFAVWAETQTEGRGRRGHAWESPSGNLYLTLALPPSPEPLAKQGMLPLKAGVLVARVLYELSGLTVTIKWPNDLFFCGKKIGGLLLETSTCGLAAGDLLIGIGLNLNLAPEVQGPYEATSLKSLTGISWPVAETANQIAERILSLWGDLDLSDVLAAFAEFQPEPSAPWLDGKTGAFMLPGELTGDGLLPMNSVEACEKVTLTSADHGMLPAYVGKAKVPLAVADVGNTATKLGWFEDARAESPALKWSLPHQSGQSQLFSALQEIARLAPLLPWTIYAVSVRPEALTVLREAASACGLNVSTTARRAVRRHGSGYDSKVLGADRVALIEALLAWWPESQRGRDRVFGGVISVGTATTIDLVSAAGEHLGGNILPGPETGLNALHLAGSLLPKLNFDTMRPEAADPVGHSTVDAMLKGVMAMTVGSIAYTLSQFQARYELRPLKDMILITGGQGKAVASALGFPYDPNLSLSGVRTLVIGGLK